MGNNYDIILIGLVAIFLILRLRSVLGKRTGNERPPARDPFTPPAPDVGLIANKTLPLVDLTCRAPCTTTASKNFTSASAPVPVAVTSLLSMVVCPEPKTNSDSTWRLLLIRTSPPLP